MQILFVQEQNEFKGWNSRCKEHHLDVLLRSPLADKKASGDARRVKNTATCGQDMKAQPGPPHINRSDRSNAT